MTDLVPASLAATLGNVVNRLERLERAIERATITPAPEWVRPDDAARIECVSVSTINRQVRNGERESNGKSGSARRVRVER